MSLQKEIELEKIRKIVYIRPSSLEDAETQFEKVKSCIENLISQREQEIAEAVEKIRFRFEPPYQCRKGEVMERFWKYQVETLNEVLSILKHNQ